MMSKKYKIQKAIVMLFIIAAFTSAFALNASAAQAVSDNAAIIYLFPDGINVPISDFGADVDTSDYVRIDPYDYIPVSGGEVIMTFNKGQMMRYDYNEGAGEWYKNVENVIGFNGGNIAHGDAFVNFVIDYIEYDWSSAPNHFNVHFAIYNQYGDVIWRDGYNDGNTYYQSPIELWIFNTSQMKIDDSNPMLYYLVTQGMLFEEKGYGRGFVNGRQRNDEELKTYYNDAYNAGFQAGVATVPVSPDGESGLFNGLLRTVIMTPIEVARDFLDINVLGTNVGAFVFGIIGLMIIVTVLILVVKLIL